MMALGYRPHQQVGEKGHHQQGRHGVHGGVVEARGWIDGALGGDFHQSGDAQSFGLQQSVELLDGRANRMLTRRLPFC